MDCIVHGVPKSWTRLSDFHFTVLSLRSELEWPPEPGDTAEKQKGNLEECSVRMVLKGMKGLEIGVQKHPACAPNSPCTNQL